MSQGVCFFDTTDNGDTISYMLVSDNTGESVNLTTGEQADDTAWDDSRADVSFNSKIGGFFIPVGDAIESGEYNLLIWNSAKASVAENTRHDYGLRVRKLASGDIISSDSLMAIPRP